MERANFFEGQRISAEDLNAITDTLGTDMHNRTIDFFSKGVIGSQNTSFVLNGANNTIRIAPFIAYTANGERIDMYQEIVGLALDLTHPEERRLRQQGDLLDDDFGWEPNVNYSIYVSYFEKGGKPKPQYETGVFYPTRVYTGFEFYAFKDIEDGSNVMTELESRIRTNGVRLCQLLYSAVTDEAGNFIDNLVITTAGFLDFTSIAASKIFTSKSPSSPVNYNPKTMVVSMEDHIMALGSGTPTPTNPHGYTPGDLGFDLVSVQTHEQRMHDNGITGNRESLSSCLYTQVNYISDNTDNLILYNLLGTERLHLNGSWLSKLAVTDANILYVNFKDGTYPVFNNLPSSVYILGVDINGNLGVCVEDSESTAINRHITLSSDPEMMDIIGTVLVTNRTVYDEGSFYDLARFEFVNTYASDKPISYILPDIPRSNFVRKSDLRTFGSTSANNLMTIKDGYTDVLALPYTLRVNSLQLANGSELDGTSVLPTGYITGLLPIYSTDNSIIVTPGKARDISDQYDIVLTKSISKLIRVPWTFGGTDQPVGGLQNANNPNLDDTAWNTTLHIFVISNGKNTDVAIDTDVNGRNILDPGSITAGYTRIRRIGSVVTAPRTSADTKISLKQFTTVSSGSGYTVYYYDMLKLKPEYNPAVSEQATVITDKNFDYTYLPNKILTVGKFSYEDANKEVYFKSTLQPQQVCFTGSGTFDMTTDMQTFRCVGSLDTNAYTVKCLGYFDGRTI